MQLANHRQPLRCRCHSFFSKDTVATRRSLAVQIQTMSIRAPGSLPCHLIRTPRLRKVAANHHLSARNREATSLRCEPTRAFRIGFMSIEKGGQPRSLAGELESRTAQRCLPSLTRSRRVPDRRCVGAFLDAGRIALRRFLIEGDCRIERVAGSRDL